MAKTRGQVACARLAAESGGVLTRAVARLHLSPRQVKRQLDTGAWVRLFPNVFRVEGVPLTWEVKCAALAAWLGPRGVLSHRTAARLHGLEVSGRDALDVTARHRLAAPPGVTVSRRGLGTKCVRVVGGFVITSVARTLVDLSAVLDATELENVVQQALRKQLVTTEELTSALAVARRTAGVVAMRALLAKLDGQGGPTESELEDRVLALLDAHALPRPQVQRRVRAGKRRARLDFVYAAQRVVIEADGYAWHSDRKSFEADRARDNALTARGFRVLRWTWKALEERPDELIAELLLVLGRG